MNEVTNVAGAIWIHGSLSSQPVCCDIPYGFGHQNVRATLLPTLAIRVSEVEVCWESVSNKTCQVQCRSDLKTNQ